MTRCTIPAVPAEGCITPQFDKRRGFRSECGSERARHAPIARASGPPEAVKRTYTLIEGRSTRGLGGAVALETLDRVLSADTEAEALLLFEDSDIIGG
jgi:hypothetical protein